MNVRLDKSFYLKPATTLAIALLGKLICRKQNDCIQKYRITETECYFGMQDTACHASKGKTARTKIMFEEGGVAYVYLCYGIHYMLNIVSGKAEHPEAVLIRGIEEANGPGKLTKLLNIDKTFNGENLCESQRFWLEDDFFKPKYITTKRIGISYATQEFQDKPWRFLVK